MLSESPRRGASCERKRPSFSPKRKCGPIRASVFASSVGMLTALRIVPSSKASRMDCAISIPTLSCASAVEAPRCGVRTSFGIFRSGGEQFIELFHQLDLQTARPRGGKVWIERKHAHSKGNGASAKLTPDPAHANNAEGLVVELDALQIFPVPSAAL